MTALAVGASVTVSVRDGGTVAIATNGGSASALVAPTEGGSLSVGIGPLPERRTLGPYAEGASIVLTNANCGSFDYDVETRFDPSSVAITGGVIGAGVRLPGVAPSLNDYSPSNPLYIAHRGSAALYPEESLLAYKRAYADGERILETDVQTLSDGSLGLMHDATVDRTTTGTGNINTFTATTFKALAMDASTWLGSNYGDTLPPAMFQELIDGFVGKAILCPEDKDAVSMTALVRALINSGVPYDQALVQCFTAANLATAVSAGYQALGLSSLGSPTASAIAATGAKWAAVQTGDALDSYIAAGLKTLVYTINRRSTRDTYLAQGAAGFFCDDPTYTRSNVAMSSTDLFSRQTWAPGMLTMNSDQGQSLVNRGSFTAPNWWGYASATPASYVGCLIGYLCPFANPQNFTLTFNAIFDAANAGDTTRWLSVFLGPTDAPYTDTNASGPGMHFLFRLNGSEEVYRKDAGQVGVLLGQATPGALATATEYTFRIIVTPTSITIGRMSGGVFVSSVTVNDTTYRGGYIQLGRNGMACRFRNVSVT